MRASLRSRLSKEVMRFVIMGVNLYGCIITSKDLEIFILYACIFVIRLYIAPMKREIFTISEFAEMSKVTRDAVYKRIKAGTLPKGVKLVKVAGKNFISIPHNMLDLQAAW